MAIDGGIFLIAGGDSALGAVLAERLRERGHKTVRTTRRRDRGPDWLPLDLTAKPQQWKLPENVGAAFLMAAVTSLERCRRETVLSRSINVTATAELGWMLADMGAFVVYPSTNLVFDGKVSFCRPNSPYSPQTEYGAQKAQAESAMRALGDRAGIVRMGKVLTPNWGLFETWIASLMHGDVIQPFTDLRFAPISAQFAAEVIVRVAESGMAGITQVTAGRDITYAEAATIIAGRIGADPSLVRPRSSADAGVELESKPENTTLDTSRLQKALNLEPPSAAATIEEWVDMYIGTAGEGKSRMTSNDE